MLDERQAFNNVTFKFTSCVYMKDSYISTVFFRFTTQDQMLNNVINILRKYFTIWTLLFSISLKVDSNTDGLLQGDPVVFNT